MSYVWSSGLDITVGRIPGISSVTIKADKTVVAVGETVNVTVTFTLDSTAPFSIDVEVALAEGSTSNILSTHKITVLPGKNSGSASFQTSFNSPGTYTLYGGARVLGKSATQPTYQPV